MTMPESRTTKEHRQKIEAVIHYIFKNLANDLSLSRLAALASYSPFHFQKLFKQVVGESPKQYIIRMRLDTAAHYLIIHRDRSVMAIAMDCGFSSPVVFSRSFKKGFGMTAEEMRSRHDDNTLVMPRRQDRFSFSPGEVATSAPAFSLHIEVKRMPAIHGVCINTVFEVERIEQAFKEVLKVARVNDMLSPGAKILGVISPHHNIYRAFVSVDAKAAVPVQLMREEIRAGKYATFKTSGTPQEAISHLFKDFYQNWLPQSGYKIADIYGFELFSESPVGRPYHTIEREIYIPVEPV